MGIFDGIMICTDLDGTLLRNDRTLSEENRSAIRYFQKEGGIFTFVTGRPAYHAEELYNAILPNAPIGCFNGGGIYDFTVREFLYLKELPKSVLDLVAYVEETLPSVGILIATHQRVCSARVNETSEAIFGRAKDPIRLSSYKEFDQPIAKIVFCESNMEQMEALIKLLNAHPLHQSFDFIRSEEYLYEILPKGVNKGAVLPKLCELLNFDPSGTVAVGDYNNDVAMIREASLGIAVANAVPEAKAVADVITVSNEEHAIARIIADLESGALSLPKHS
jgi:Cof subfamily protein (haloacid dehalogenase superfamily)